MPRCGRRAAGERERLTLRLAVAFSEEDGVDVDGGVEAEGGGGLVWEEEDDDVADT